MGTVTMKRKNIPLSENLSTLFEAEVGVGQTGIPDWLAEERDVCRGMVLANGLPGQGLEQWKYTNVAALNEVDWELPSKTLDTNQPVADESDPNVIHLTLINGQYLEADKNDIPEGLEVRALSNPASIDCIKPVLQRTNYRLESIFTLMNRALWTDGLCIQTAAETNVRLHIHLVYGGAGRSPVISAPRVYIKTGEHSQVELTLTQWNRDKAPTFGTACIDLDLDAGSKVTYAHEQRLNPVSYQFTTTRTNIARDACIYALDLATGAALSRHDLTASLQESGSEAHMNGIYLLRDRQTSDFHTVIEHRKPYCNSRQIYKGVLDDHAHAVFNGLVEVHPGAMGTDGYQLNRTLLRSPQAVVDTKPELQIHNDDVKCSHGATVGQLDPLELFYLQSRCIPTEEAKAILSRAFVVDLIHQQPSEYQQNRLHKSVHDFFNQA